MDAPSDSSLSDSSRMTSTKKSSVGEFNDGRKRPKYLYKDSFNDWIRHSWFGKVTDQLVESLLLSVLPFWPDLDGKRVAEIINTDVGGGDFIHELYIENTQQPKTDGVRDIVLVHGYAASLGLFFDNFNDLSLEPGVKIHAIDLPGHGLSLRPSFPKFPCDTKEDIYKVEDWFIDKIEEWRKRRGINQFVLVGHSFGGYLSCAYALKYNKPVDENKLLIDKLVLLSPVGVERNRFSLLKSTNDSADKKVQDQGDPGLAISEEVEQNQEDVVTGNELTRVSDSDEPKLRGRQLFDYLWKKHVSPFVIMRLMGPFSSKLMSGWTTHRFSHIYYEDPQRFENIHQYFFRIFRAHGSGEYAITRVLAPGALARLPLLDRCPEKFAKMKLPTLWVYGDKDWMNDQAGEQMVGEINKASKTPLASFAMLPNAGHHLYLDNPPEFARVFFKFLNMGK